MWPSIQPSANAAPPRLGALGYWNAMVVFFGGLLALSTTNLAFALLQT
jgi:hypothetical protein